MGSRTYCPDRECHRQHGRTCLQAFPSKPWEWCDWCDARKRGTVLARFPEPGEVE